MVEHDASVMRGDGMWAGIGAVQGLHNPILAAHQLALESTMPMSCGRVRPMYVFVLVGIVVWVSCGDNMFMIMCCSP